MILPALCEFYDNRHSIHTLNENPKGVPAECLSIEPISFALVIDKNGSMLDLVDIRKTDSKGKSRTIEMIVPESVIGRAGKVIKPNFLWDNSGYFFGADDKGKPKRCREKFDSFLVLHRSVAMNCPSNPLMSAVIKFLESWDQSVADTKLRSLIMSRIDEKDFFSGNMVFMIQDENYHGFVHENRQIYDAWREYRLSQRDPKEGSCLISGKNLPIARLHHLIKGVADAQSTGAAIISFNLDAFESYGKTQNFNAPISELAAFKYTTALNRLLMRSFGQRIQIGDATTVFWTEQVSAVEDYWGYILNPGEDPAVDLAHTKKVEDYLRAVRKGIRPCEIKDDSMRFYILGLAPNASRLSVRFWYTDSVAAVNRHLKNHFEDLEIVRESDNQLKFPGIWHLLVETAPLRKTDNINPNLAGALMRSILEGIAYPASLLAAVIGRIRADHEINYYRAATIKAVLRRNYNQQEVTMALNEDSTNVAYRLGRLFAALEKAQEEAVGASATIKDRFFGSASATPRVVFPQLIRLSQHHLAKLDEGSKVYKERLIQSILDGIDATHGFPPHLTLEDQGMFALGYYHQRKAFFTKKEVERDLDSTVSAQD